MVSTTSRGALSPQERGGLRLRHPSFYQSQCSSWPVAYLGSQVISPHSSCPIHDVSCLLPSSSLHACQSGLTVPCSFLYCLFSSSALVHHCRAHYIVGPSAADFSLFPPLRPLMYASYH